MGMFDTEKTWHLGRLCSVPQEQRDAAWREEFFENVIDASLVANEQQVIRGPDKFPYFALFLPQEAGKIVPFCVSHILEHCTDDGYGIVVSTPGKPQPEWVFTYGDLWGLRVHGEFRRRVEAEGDGTGTGLNVDRLAPGEKREVLTGSPSFELFPSFARDILRGYFQQTIGVEVPKVTLVDDATREPSQSLVFNVPPERFPSIEAMHAYYARLAWFFPPGLSLLANDGGVQWTFHADL